MQLKILWHQYYCYIPFDFLKDWRSIPLDFLKDWPSNLSIATKLALPWVYSTIIITTVKQQTKTI